MSTIQSSVVNRCVNGGGLPPTVLVVDDDDTLLMVLTRELRRRGFIVCSASTGQEAIVVYRRLVGRIDVVLLDVNMPGMNGPVVFAALRATDPRVQCCFMTADTRPETLSAIRTAGGRKILAKPFASLAEVCEILRGLVEGSRGERCETVGVGYADIGPTRRLREEGD